MGTGIDRELRGDISGRCNMRRACDPSSHWFRQGGLDLITFNFPPAITFPVDHFSLQVKVHVCVCINYCVSVRKERNRNEEVYVFKAEAFAVGAVFWKLWVPSSVIWFLWHCLWRLNQSDFFFPLTHWYVCGFMCARPLHYVKHLQGTTQSARLVPGEASWEHLIGWAAESGVN